MYSEESRQRTTKAKINAQGGVDNAVKLLLKLQDNKHQPQETSLKIY